MDKNSKNNNDLENFNLNNNLQNEENNNEEQDNPYYNPYFQNADLSNSNELPEFNIYVQPAEYNKENIESPYAPPINPNHNESKKQKLDINIPSNENGTISRQKNDYDNVDNNIVSNEVNLFDMEDTNGMEDIDDMGNADNNNMISNTNKIINPIPEPLNNPNEFSSNVNNSTINSQVSASTKPVNQILQNNSINYNEIPNTDNFTNEQIQDIQNFGTEFQKDFSEQQKNNTINTFNSDSTTYNSLDNQTPSKANNNSYSDNNSQNFYGNQNDESFKRLWMDKLYEKAYKKKFNIPAFFFGGLYYLFRKLYLPGVLMILVNALLYSGGIYFSFSNNSNISAILGTMGIFTCIGIILNIIYGFTFYPLYKRQINKMLTKLKPTVQSPSQLLDSAKEKGGTNAFSVVLGIIFSGILNIILTSAIASTALLELLPNLSGNLSITPNNETNNNITANVENDNLSNTSTYTFYNNYSFDYNNTKWSLNAQDNSLINNNYKLSFIQSLENLSGYGYDITTDNGRSSFFTFLYNSFSSQIDASTTLELGASSFTPTSSGLYLSYLDLVYETSIERCYFILIPEDNIFIELILSNQDTVISDDINTEINEYINNITNTPPSIMTEKNNTTNNDNNQNSNNNNTNASSGVNTVSNISSFQPYFGSTSGSNVKALLTKVTANNNSIENQQDIGNKIYVYLRDTLSNIDGEVPSSLNNTLISSQKNYTVSLPNNNSSDNIGYGDGYWTNGNIKSIFIEAIN